MGNINFYIPEWWLWMLGILFILEILNILLDLYKKYIQRKINKLKRQKHNIW